MVINHVDKEWAPLNLLCQRLALRFPHAFANMFATQPSRSHLAASSLLPCLGGGVWTARPSQRGAACHAYRGHPRHGRYLTPSQSQAVHPHSDDR